MLRAAREMEGVMTTSPRKPEPITPVDRAWLRMDEPDNLMIITGVMTLDRMDLATLRRVVAERSAVAKRFRQRLETRNGKTCWADDPAFDIDHHVRAIKLDPPGNKAALEATVGRMMAEPLPHDKPLWRFYLAPYGDKNVMISRLHHAVGDGVGLMMVLLSLTDLRATGVDGETPASPFAALFDASRSVRDAAVERARAIMPEVINLMSRVSGGGSGGGRRPGKVKVAAGMSGALAAMAVRGPDPKTPFKGPLSVEKRVAWSRLVDLDEITTIRGALGGTINDILLTAMSGGLRQYLVDRGQAVDGLNLRAAIPVSLRKIDQLADMGNRFGLVFLSLPVGIAEPRERLAALRERMTALKRSYEAPVVLGVLHAMGLAPLPLQRLVERIFGAKATAVMTNVPGPRETLYLGGSTIEDIFFWVPQSGRLGLGISILSYDQRVRLGVATDAGLVPDPGGIIDGFHRELDELRTLTAS